MGVFEYYLQVLLPGPLANEFHKHLFFAFYALFRPEKKPDHETTTTPITHSAIITIQLTMEPVDGLSVLRSL